MMHKNTFPLANRSARKGTLVHHCAETLRAERSARYRTPPFTHCRQTAVTTNIHELVLCLKANEIFYRASEMVFRVRVLVPSWSTYRVAQKHGHPISLQIFWKLHDRIAWKLVNFCNIICWKQSLTLFKNFITVAPSSENTATVVYSHCRNRFEHHIVAVFR